MIARLESGTFNATIVRWNRISEQKGPTVTDRSLTTATAPLALTSNGERPSDRESRVVRVVRKSIPDYFSLHVTASYERRSLLCLCTVYARFGRIKLWRLKAKHIVNLNLLPYLGFFLEGIKFCLARYCLKSQVVWIRLKEGRRKGKDMDNSSVSSPLKRNYTIDFSKMWPEAKYNVF